MPSKNNMLTMESLGSIFLEKTTYFARAIFEIKCYLTVSIVSGYLYVNQYRI